MLTTTSYQTRYGQLTNNAETTALALGLFEINQAIKQTCSKNGGRWWFLEKTKTKTTVASQRGYSIPQSVRKIMDVYVTVGTTIYSPVAIEDPETWKTVLQRQSGESDRAMFYYREGNTLYLDPIPASSSNTITIRYRRKVNDLSAADYTTGTVTGTLDSATIAGSGTTFTAGMVGRYINLTSGDGLWYEIGTFTSTTSIAAVAPYEGVTVAGSAFTIGESSPLPEDYQEIPLYIAVSRYYMKNKDLAVSRDYQTRADELFQNMMDEAKQKTEAVYLPSVNNLVFRDPNVPPPFVTTAAFT